MKYDYYGSAAFVFGMGLALPAWSQASLPQEIPAFPVHSVGAAARPKGGIEEVIVTAERTRQSVQKAPLTIQVISGANLLKAGLTTVEDLSKLTTGLDIGNAGGSAQIYVRGVGSYTVSPLTSPGVAFNIDGVYVGRANGINGNFYDISRVEVLKGPQGTLYGRNANGGSINLITNDARIGHETANLNVEAGNYGLIHTSGAVNLPVSSTVAVRVAFNVARHDGYLSNGADDDDEESGRVRLLWQANQDVTVRLNADYSYQGGKGEDYVYLPRRPGGDPYEAESEPAANAYLHSFGGLAEKPFQDDVLNDESQRVQDYNFSGQLDWKLGNLATLTVIPAYRNVEDYFRYHFGGRLTDRSDTNQKSIEVRLGNTIQNLTWVVGGYGFDEQSPHVQNYIYNSVILQNLEQIYASGTKSYAGFGQATLEVLKGLRLIGGVRYTNETQKLLGGFYQLDPVPPVQFEHFDGDPTFSAVTYKVGAEYDIAPRNMIFITYSTGYKAGGLNQTVAPLDTYKPERLDALEVGSRNRFLDDRLQLNFGAFHWKYKSIQDSRTTFDPLGQVNFLTLNSGNATLYGANADIVAKPTANDTIRLSGEWTHSKYDNFFYALPAFVYSPLNNGCRNAGTFLPGATLPYTQQNGSRINRNPAPVVVSDCSGFQVARVPNFTGTIDYTHDFQFRGGAVLAFDGSVKYVGSRWLNVDFFSAERAQDYVVLDADLTYTPPSGRWSVGVFGRNLTKEVYYSGGVTAAFVPGLYAANIAPPRTYGFRASINFGQ